MAKKIMIIGAGDFQIPLIEYAAENHEVVLVAPEVDDAVAEKVSSVYKMDVRDREEILKIAEAEKIDGAITDQTDIPVRTVAYISEKLGLPGIGYETSKLFTDKSLMDRRLEELNLCRIPSCSTSSVEEAVSFMEGLGRSVLIKPNDSQGSRGIFSCSTAEELRTSYEEAKQFSSDGTVLVQREISGREFFVESMTLNGETVNLIIGDTVYFTTRKSYSAKTRITPSIADAHLVNRILAVNQKIIKGFGLNQGITHSEYIVEDDEIYLLETAARGGGVYISSDLISIATGLHTEEFLVNICLGEQKSLPDIVAGGPACGYLAFYLPVGEVVDISGVSEVEALPYVHRNQLYKIHEGMVNNSAASDKTSRYAVIVSAEDNDELTARMDYIRETLKIKVKTNEGYSYPIWD